MTTDFDKLSKILSDAVRVLREHFDSVQVIACHSDNDGTTMFDRGSGSFYERTGATRAWIEHRTESDLEDVRQDAKDARDQE